MMTMILSTLNQRHQEISLLRTVGASTWVIFGLIQLEILLITTGGIITGLLLLWLGIVIAQPLITEFYGLSISTLPYTLNTLYYAAGVIITAQLLACFPAWKAYKN